ncbi:MAG: TlpA disulfide reductase family protein [Bacteroidota bacterium]
MEKILFLALMVFQTLAFSQEEYPYVDDRGFVVKLGQQAPDFKIIYVNGKSSVKLSDLKGELVLLQFTASWCGVCRKEMPHIEKEIWQVYKNRRIHVIGIDRKEPLEKVKSFAKTMKITYPLALDLDDKIYTSYAHPNSGVTRNVLIDKTGKIVFLTRLYKKKEFNELVNKIDELINK